MSGELVLRVADLEREYVGVLVSSENVFIESVVSVDSVES